MAGPLGADTPPHLTEMAGLAEVLRVEQGPAPQLVHRVHQTGEDREAPGLSAPAVMVINILAALVALTVAAVAVATMVVAGVAKALG